MQSNVENLKVSSFTLKMPHAREGKALFKSEESLEKISRGRAGGLL